MAVLCYIPSDAATPRLGLEIDVMHYCMSAMLFLLARDVEAIAMPLLETDG